MTIIEAIEAEQLRKDIPDFKVGDTVKVWVKVIEGSRERLQAFEGTVIARRNGSARETFTVRRLSYGVGVERHIPDPFAKAGPHRDHSPWPRTQSKALLPARQSRKGCEGQGIHCGKISLNSQEVSHREASFLSFGGRCKY